MKKLATAIAAVTALAFATPAFACPHKDGVKSEEKTADKKTEKKDESTTQKEKQDSTKDAKKDTAKNGDQGKVSRR